MAAEKVGGNPVSLVGVFIDDDKYKWTKILYLDVKCIEK